MISDRGATTPTVTRPIAFGWEAWALLAAAAAAVAVGTIVRGFLGTDWYFNADNVADSAPAALPFLIAAGVVIGAGRWPSGGRALAIGAALLAVSGAASVVTSILLAVVTTNGGLVDLNGLFLAIGILNGASLTVAYSSLAIGLWRSAPDGSGTARMVAGIGVAVITLAAAAGPLVTTAASISGGDVALYVLGAALTSASVAALGALAVAAVRATPTRTPLPEVLVAAGASINAIVAGGSWWLLATVPGQSTAFDLLTVAQPVGNIAALVLAAGFASGALFWPAED